MTVTMVVTEPIKVKGEIGKEPWPVVIRTGDLTLILNTKDAQQLADLLEATLQDLALHSEGPLPVFTPEVRAL